MKIDISEFLQKAETLPVIDVRTPAEFERAHLPGAFNIPLFSNEERAAVGTRYKQESRDTAIAEALCIIAAKVDFYLDELEKLNLPFGKILLYCWRGGMRSAGMAALFRAAGWQVYVLEGGYKSYRKAVLLSFEQPWQLNIIGGMTGSGKSDVLLEIGKLGEQFVDLEAIAHHKGSAFGSLGQQPQPTLEQFENNLHDAFAKLDRQKCIWLEDESQLIGKVRIPKPLFDQMRTARVFKLELSKEIRIKRLFREYTDFAKDLVIASIRNISRRLGGLVTRKAIEAVGQNDFLTAIDLVLSYYDKTYSYGLRQRKKQMVISIRLKEDNPQKAAEKILRTSRKISCKNPV